MERHSCTHCSNDSSMSSSNGFCPAPSSRFLLPLSLAASSFQFAFLLSPFSYSLAVDTKLCCRFSVTVTIFCKSNSLEFKLARIRRVLQPCMRCRCQIYTCFHYVNTRNAGYGHDTRPSMRYFEKTENDHPLEETTLHHVPNTCVTFVHCLKHGACKLYLHLADGLRNRICVCDKGTSFL